METNCEESLSSCLHSEKQGILENQIIALGLNILRLRLYRLAKSSAKSLAFEETLGASQHWAKERERL